MVCAGPVLTSVSINNHTKVTTAGTAENQKIVADNHSTYNDKETIVKNTHVTANNHSSISLHVTDYINGQINNQSFLDFKGKPKCNISCDKNSKIYGLK